MNIMSHVTAPRMEYRSFSRPSKWMELFTEPRCVADRPPIIQGTRMGRVNKDDEGWMGRYTNLSNVEGGGVGVLDRGKLATSRPAARDLIDPNGWSGDSWATGATMPLKQNCAGYHERRKGDLSDAKKKLKLNIVLSDPVS